MRMNKEELKLKEKLLKIIDNHFQEKYGLDYAVDDFLKLILNREKKQREEIVEMVKNTPKYKQDKSCVPNRTRIKTIKEYKQDIINSLNK